ncbi:hypothetical protein QTI24_26645 [Variovorax sp. J22P240]|uniref:hypothetical protein n=1 Tax=Variovorax sp. J22P240 TaxID=3053514 RepID=UPI0025786C9D|nr:hypothetical protein [Variovorax sp. J22P240]MDM0002212.1 hypothetical protein [Variovorax sp. J22P240]
MPPLTSTGYDDFLPQAGPAIPDPSEGNIALDLQARRLAARKQALVDQAKQAQALNQSLQGQTISGGPKFTDIYVPAPKLAGFLPIAQQAVQQYQQKLLDEDTSAYDKTMSAAAIQHLKSKPSEDADENTKLAWAQTGSQLPVLKSVMDAYIEDQIVKQPGRQATQAFERRKQSETERHNKAMEGKPANPNYLPIFNNQTGALTGSYDTRTRTVYDANDRPISGPGVSLPAGTTTTAPASSVSKGPSVTHQVSEGKAQEKVANIDTILGYVRQASPAVDEVNQGVKGAAKDLWTLAKGDSTASTRARDALNVFAENLKPFYNRPPGDPTAREVAAWGKAMGDLNRAIANKGNTQAAINALESIMLQQRERLTGEATEPESLRGTLERVIAQRGGEPTGSFDPGTDPSKFDIADPLEREMARRAYANQQKAKKPATSSGGWSSRRLD